MNKENNLEEKEQKDRKKFLEFYAFIIKKYAKKNNTRKVKESK